jgi:hypothetical protein
VWTLGSWAGRMKEVNLAIIFGFGSSLKVAVTQSQRRSTRDDLNEAGSQVFQRVHMYTG